jgi:hypothetical protein
VVSSAGFSLSFPKRTDFTTNHFCLQDSVRAHAHHRMRRAERQGRVDHRHLVGLNFCRWHHHGLGNPRGTACRYRPLFHFLHLAGESVYGTDFDLQFENDPTSIENKRVAARDHADPILMFGGAPRTHEVLTECGMGREKPVTENTFLRTRRSVHLPSETSI